MFKSLHNSLLSLVSPQECNVCSLAVDDIDAGVACSECWSATRIFGPDHVLCPKCGAYIDDSGRENTFQCSQCREHHYDRAAAAGIYEKALAATVIHLKTTPRIAPFASRVFCMAFENAGFGESTLIIPIPLSKRRQFERGYNQADVLGKVIARSFGIALDSKSLVRKLHSPLHRVGMDMKARELTVANAFEVHRPNLIKGQNIVLVDDVFTSGSTSSNCARILKKNGASTVNVFTLARAVLR